MQTKKNETYISLCIPRLSMDTKETFIRKTFNDLNLGEIGRIDLIVKRNDKGENFKRAFIHYLKWNDNENALYVKSRLDNEQDIKVVYDNPWYWKVSINKSTKLN